MRESSKVLIAQWTILGALLLVWQFCGMHSATANFLLGTPTAILSQLWQLAVSGEFFKDMAITGAEALGGLVIGTLLGTAAGLAAWLSKTVAAVTKPYVLALSSFPVFAIAPLMIVWFGLGMSMKVAFASMATVFVAFNQAYQGANMVSKEYLEVMEAFGAPRLLQFRKVVVPASIDWVLAALRVNTGLSLLGAFIGEFVSSDRGLGHVILQAAGLYQVPKALAGACGIVLLAALFNWLGGLIEERRSLLGQYLSVPRAVRGYR